MSDIKTSDSRQDEIEFSTEEIAEMKVELAGRRPMASDALVRLESERRRALTMPDTLVHGGPPMEAKTEPSMSAFGPESDPADLLVDHAFSNGGRAEGVVLLWQGQSGQTTPKTQAEPSAVTPENSGPAIEIDTIELMEVRDQRARARTIPRLQPDGAAAKTMEGIAPILPMPPAAAKPPAASTKAPAGSLSIEEKQLSQAMERAPLPEQKTQQIYIEPESDTPPAGPRTDKATVEMPIVEVSQRSVAPPPMPAAASAQPVSAVPPPMPANATPPMPMSAVTAPPLPASSEPAGEVRTIEAPPASDFAPRPRRRRAKQWFEEVFEEDHLRTLPGITPRQTQREAEFIHQSLQGNSTSAPNGALLDVGCGAGRHALELAQRGYHVTGVDLSLPMLIRAADSARKSGISVNFIHGDMREMTFDSEFDGAYCMFTTFGYFDDDTNRATLANVARALKPGGKLILDVANRDYLVRDLPTRVWWEGEGCVVLEEVDFNHFVSRLQVQRSIIFDDGRQQEHEISIRAYSLHEIGKLFHQCGLKVTEVSGGLALRGNFFGAHSRQLLVVAEKMAPSKK